jgi:hypothetical protein
MLTLRHIMGLAHLFATHRYVLSRESLYRRIEEVGNPGLRLRPTRAAVPVAD